MNQIITILLLSLACGLQGQPNQLVLPVGHTEDIFKTHITGDSRYAVSMSHDNTVKLWDCRTGVLINTFSRLNHKSADLVNFGLSSYLTDDRYLTGLTTSGTIAKYDLISGERIFEVGEKAVSLRNIEVSPDGKFILSYGSMHQQHGVSGIIQMRDGLKGRLLYQITEGKDSQYYEFTNARISPANRFLLTFSDKQVSLRQLKSGSVFRVMPFEDILDVSFLPDSNRILILSGTRAAYIWNIATGRVFSFRSGNYLVPSSDGQLMLVQERDGFSLLNLEEGNWIYERKFPKKAFPDRILAFSPDSRFIYLAKPRSFIAQPSDSNTFIWSVDKGEMIFHPMQKDISHVVFSGDQKHCITVSYFEAVIWDLHSRKKLKVLKADEPINDANFSQDGKNLILTCGTKLQVYAYPFFNLVHTLKGYANPIVHAEFSSNSRSLLTVSNEKTVRIWDLDRGGICQTFKDTATIRVAQFSSDGKYLLTSGDAEARLWKISTGEEVRKLYHYGAIQAGAFSPGGFFITIAGQSAVIWIVEDMTFVRELHEQTNIRKAEMSPDGKWAFTIRSDGAATLWKVDRKDAEMRITHGKPIIDAEISPDNKYLLTVSEDISRLWELGTGRLVKEFGQESKTERGVSYIGPGEKHLWKHEFANFSPDSSRLLVHRVLEDHISIVDLRNLSGSGTISDPSSTIISAAFAPLSGNLITCSLNDTVRIWLRKKGRNEYMLLKSFPGQGFVISPDGKRLGIANSAELLVYDLVNNREVYRALAVNEDDYMTVLPDYRYYTGTKNAVAKLAFKNKGRIYTFEQADYRYNRPDLVLEQIGNAFGSKDSTLIKAYYNAYQKRLKRLGMDTSLFAEANPPQGGFSFEPDYEQGSSVSVRIFGLDSQFMLDRINLWVNDVPVWGVEGLDLRGRNIRRFDTLVKVELLPGENRLESSVVNSRGVESHKTPLQIRNTNTKDKGKVWFIGIGIDHYKDSYYNLAYAVKDIKDLTTALKQKFGSDLKVDTLLNESVTLDNIRRLRERLMKTHTDDKVIIAYSGHGLLSRQYDYYLSTWDVNFQSPATGGLPYDELQKLLDGIPAQRRLMLIDACHSGEIDKEELALNTPENGPGKNTGKKGAVPVLDPRLMPPSGSYELMQELFVDIGKSTGAVVICASTGMQAAFEGGGVRNGVFTAVMLDLLRKRKSCYVKELSDLLRQQVETKTKGMQVPVLRPGSVAMNWQIW